MDTEELRVLLDELREDTKSLSQVARSNDIWTCILRIGDCIDTIERFAATVTELLETGREMGKANDK